MKFSMWTMDAVRAEVFPIILRYRRKPSAALRYLRANGCVPRFIANQVSSCDCVIRSRSRIALSSRLTCRRTVQTYQAATATRGTAASKVRVYSCCGRCSTASPVPPGRRSLYSIAPVSRLAALMRDGKDLRPVECIFFVHDCVRDAIEVVAALTPPLL